MSADGGPAPSGACPVCLQAIAADQEAFLDACYHRFCLKARPELASPLERGA